MVGFQRAINTNMRLYDRISEYHSKSRSAFVLFTELIAFVGMIATIVGTAKRTTVLGMQWVGNITHGVTPQRESQ